MEEFILYVHRSAPKYDKANNKIFMAAFLFFIAITFFIIRPSSITGVLTLTLALIPVAVLFAIFYKEKLFLPRCFIRLDDQKIETYFFNTRIDFIDIKAAWQEIASVTIHPLFIEIFLHTGSKQTLRFDSFNDKEQSLFKTKLEEFLMFQKIPFKKKVYNTF
jgi:hypothetical protein